MIYAEYSRITGGTRMKEKITNLLRYQFVTVECNECQWYKNDEGMSWCTTCQKNRNYWQISDKLAEDIANRIYKIIENERR